MSELVRGLVAFGELGFRGCLRKDFYEFFE